MKNELYVEKDNKSVYRTPLAITVVGSAVASYGIVMDNPGIVTSGLMLIAFGAGDVCGDVLHGSKYHEITPPEGQEVVIEFHEDKEPSFYLQAKPIA